MAGTLNFGTKQTLSSLNIAPGGVVTINDVPSAAMAAAVVPIAAPDEGLENFGDSAQAVPEPGAWSLLALGALGFLGRRRGK